MEAWHADQLNLIGRGEGIGLVIRVIGLGEVEVDVEGGRTDVECASLGPEIELLSEDSDREFAGLADLLETQKAVELGCG